jgi:hypothetical protein
MLILWFCTTFFCLVLEYVYLVLSLLYFVSVAMGHARIKYLRPLAVPDDRPAGNYCNNPLRRNESEFLCKGPRKKSGVNKNSTATWQAGQQSHFE